MRLSSCDFEDYQRVYKTVKRVYIFSLEILSLWIALSLVGVFLSPDVDVKLGRVWVLCSWVGVCAPHTQTFTLECTVFGE